MRTMTKRVLRDESGKILILVLVLLVVGGLLLTPLLGLMSTGLMAGQVYEKKASELYAADAGVEAAIWGIQTRNLNFVDDRVSLDPLTVNEKTVGVNVEREDLGITACKTYRQYRYYIVSEADADDSSTTVNAVLSAWYLLPMDFSGMLDYAICSSGSITLQPGGGRNGTQVHGNVWLPDADDLQNKAEINGEVKDSTDASVTWPTFEQLSAYYGHDVSGVQPEPDGYVIDIDGRAHDDPYVVGPLHVAGDLTITGSGWIRLDGTVYVERDLFINPTPEIHLDLNGKTIFVRRDIKVNPGRDINLYGSGCIIAGRDIQLQPNIDSESGDFVLVLSLGGEVSLNPGSDFTGCIAGNAHVQLQPGNVVTWISPADKGLNFPMGQDEGGEVDVDKLPMTELSIFSWQVQSGGQ